MATQSQNINLGLNAQDLLAGLNASITAFGGTADAIDSIISVTERFNKDGKITGGVVKGLTKDFREYTISLTAAKNASDALIRNAATVPKGLTVGRRSIRATRDQTESEALTPANIGLGQAAASAVRQQFPAPPAATLVQLARYENQITKIQALLAKGKITGVRFNEIFTAFNAGNLQNLVLSGDEQKLVTSLQNIGKGFTTAKDEGERFHLGLRSAFRIAEALVFKELVGSIVSGLKQATQAAIDFQIKISEIRTLATENASSFEAWSKSIDQVSGSLGIDQVDVAKAAYNALSSQIVESREDTVKFIKTAGDLARVGVSDIKQAGDLLTSVINSYGLSVARSEEISAKLFVAVDRGSFTIAELAGNMGRVNNTAAALGVTFEETLASLTTLTRQGNNAADAETQLSNIFLKLQKPTETTSKFLKSLGFESGQAAIQALGFVGVLKQIETATKGDIQTLSEFGGELRAIRGLIGLTTRGKSGEFEADLALLQTDSIKRFNAAKVIRGESAGDELTKEFTKIKNFFVNEFGQSTLNTAASLTKEIGGLASVVKQLVNVAVPLGTTFLAYYAATKVAVLGTTVFAAGLNRLTGAAAITDLQMKKNAATTAALGKGLNALVGIGVFVILTNEVLKFKRELNDTNKKAEDYETTLKRIKNARENKDESGNNIGAEKLNTNILAQAGQFAVSIDKLYQPLFQKQAEASRTAQQAMDRLQVEGKETATQLSLGFKNALDSINNTVKTYSEGITKAEQQINNSKKSILSLKETVSGLIFDLKFDFASSAQQFILRDQQIKELVDESTRLLQSDNDEDLNKGRELSKIAIQKVKEDERARLAARVDNERARREAQFNKTGQADNSPIQVSTVESEDRLKSFLNFYEDLEKKAINRKQIEKTTNESQIQQEKEKARLLEKRVKSFEELTLLQADGSVNPQFTDGTGKLDANKFNKELERRSERILSILDGETKLTNQTEILNRLEDQKLNLLEQQTKQLEIQNINRKSQDLGLKRDEAKKEIEDNAKRRVEINNSFEKAGKGLEVSVNFMRDILETAQQDNQASTIGKNDDPVTRFSKQVAAAVADGINYLVPEEKEFSSTQRAAVARANRPLINNINRDIGEFDEQRKALLARDSSGKLTGTEQNVRNLLALQTRLEGQFVQLFKAFNAQQDPNTATSEKGVTFRETRAQSRGELENALNLFAQQRDAQTRLELLQNRLSATFTPQETAIANNTEAISILTRGLQNFTIELLKIIPRIAVPSNIPAPVVGGQGFHNGGLIKGPRGYDNLVIRAEAGEFVMNQTATKKWLPQLIAMNGGIAPKVAGRYHEGGLVQTNVGDVNVTIHAPPTPLGTLKEIGKGLRREIRRGNLNLNKKS